MYPDTTPKRRGDYVENVHPCATYTDRGVVLDYDVDPAGYVRVKMGAGYEVYGPAENWTIVDRAPAWLEEAREIQPGETATAYLKRRGRVKEA
jgi:hypothetical protein